MQKTVLIGVPSLSEMKTGTVRSLFHTASALEVPAKLHFVTECYIHVARNKIVKEALRMGATHLMFIDSDMAFPADGVNRLLEQDKDIIGGLYYRRQAPNLPTINKLVDNQIVVPHKFETKKPFKIWSVATGFMLIKTSVFKKIAYPWFYFGNYKGQEMGEDVYFCRKAQEKKIEVWCDPTIPLKHIGEYEYGYDDYKAYDDLRPKEDVPDEFDGTVK